MRPCLVSAILLAVSLLPAPLRAVCPSTARLVPVQPGRGEIVLVKSALLADLPGVSIVGFVAPSHGTLEDVGSRYLYRPSPSFWTAGLDSFLLRVSSSGSSDRLPPRAETVFLVPALSADRQISQDFEHGLTWPQTGTGGLEIVTGADAPSNRSLRITGSPETSSWLSGYFQEPYFGGGNQGTTVQSTLRPPGAGGPPSGLLEPDFPIEVVFLELGTFQRIEHRLRLRDDTLSLALRLESPHGASGWVPVSRSPHRLQVSQWAGNPDGSRRPGAFLFVDGALAAQLQPPAGTDIFDRVGGLHLGSIEAFGLAPLSFEVDDVRLSSNAPGPASLCLGADGFESGQLDPMWTVVSGTVAATSEAALAGRLGGEISLGTWSSPAGALLQARLPEAAPRLGVRFRFDPNSLSVPPAGEILLLEGVAGGSGRRSFALVLKKGFSGYLLTLFGEDDRGEVLTAPPIALADVPGVLTLDWQRSPGPGASSGSLRLFAGSTLVGQVTGLANDSQDVEMLRAGALAVNGAFLGRVFLDQIEIVRGPEP